MILLKNELILNIEVNYLVLKNRPIFHKFVANFVKIERFFRTKHFS